MDDKSPKQFLVVQWIQMYASLLNVWRHYIQWRTVQCAFKRRYRLSITQLKNCSRFAVLFHRLGMWNILGVIIIESISNLLSWITYRYHKIKIEKCWPTHKYIGQSFKQYLLWYFQILFCWIFRLQHWFYTFKLMKGKALRKHSLHEKTAASVLLKLFISSNEWCHTTDAP